MSPWWASSGTDKNSFETCSSSDMDSEVPSMQLLTGVSGVINSFYDSDNSFQSIYNSSEDDDLNSGRKNKSVEQCTDLSDAFIQATKHTVKGCL